MFVFLTDDFSKQIDHDAKKLLQILPAYDPGAGHVSPQCRRHADIFHRELSKFTLWALKSKFAILLELQSMYQVYRKVLSENVISSFQIRVCLQKWNQQIIITLGISH